MPVSASSSWTADPPCVVAARWVSAHLYYHGALDDLLRCAIDPLVDELAEGGLTDGFFFIRYWQGGPHLRLRVRLRDQADAQPVEKMIEAGTGRFFARCPSQTLMCSEDYQRIAERRSRHEFGQRGTMIEPLQPNNSLRYVPYAPEEDRLGGPAGVAAFEPHFMDSSVLALELIDADPDRQRLTGRALAMMLIAAVVFIPNPKRLARFFRYSYWNWGTRNAVTDPDRYARYEIQFEQRYERQRVQLDDLVQQLVGEARVGVGNHLDGISARWTRSVAALRDRFTTQQPTQRLSVESRLFQCLHKHNNRLGISTVEETYLLFLLQRTLTEIAEEKDRNE
ncbi:MAG: thiopeptide-type bacteriocin biosynthesis protein [Pseudomonas sp.]